MTDELTRAFVSDIEVRSDGTGRTVHGIVVPFDSVARVSDGGRPYDEGFRRGAFKRTIDRGAIARVKLLSQHNARSNPLGRATMLREDRGGLYGEFHVSKTTAGDEALELLRDGALDSFSVGFRPVQAANESGVTWRTEVAIREASLVTFPSYETALVGGVRSLADLSDEAREELLAYVTSHIDLRSITPAGDPMDRDTSESPEPVTASEDPVSPAAPSPKQVHRNLRAKAREEGGPLS